MLEAKQPMYIKQSSNRLPLLALWFAVVFIVSQGLVWFHPHGGHHLPADVSQYCQIQFCDEASFCPHDKGTVHLESSGHNDFSECRSCQQLIELSQYNFGILLLSCAAIETICTPLPPLPLTAIYSATCSERAPPRLFA